MTMYSTGTITLAEGHAIEGAVVYKKRRILDDLTINSVLKKASLLTSVKTSKKLLDLGQFGDVDIADASRAAAVNKDWAVVDQLVLDVLAQKRSVYAMVLDAEEWMRAFSGRLCAEVETAHAAFRWMDPPELESYLSGTFESRVESNHMRRGFKALSMNPDLKFLSRKVMMTVPLNNDIRDCVRCIRYTALPRRVKAEDERIGDDKSARNAVEAEIRVPDGTPVPAGTTFTLQKNTSVDRRVITRLGEMYAVTVK